MVWLWILPPLVLLVVVLGAALLEVIDQAEADDQDG